MKKIFLIALLVINLVFVACGQPEEFKQEGEDLKVYNSFYPLYFISESIGGELVNSQLLIPAGSEVHNYEISPRKIAKLEGADLFFYNGLGLEPWAERVVENIEKVGVRAVKVTEVLQLLEFEEHSHHHEHQESEIHHSEEEHQHQHGENESYHSEEEHHHGDYDPHVWLDPLNMKSMAQEILNEFVKADPDNEEYYQINYEKLAEELRELDQNYKDVLANRRQDYILVSHSAFGYLAHRYDLKELAVAGISPHQEPSTGGLAKLSEQVKEYGIDYIFLETLANPRTAEVLAQEVDLEVLTLNPIEGLTMAQKKANQNYLSIMEDNLNTLEKALVD